jgi:hypothetical protein
MTFNILCLAYEMGYNFDISLLLLYGRIRDFGGRFNEYKTLGIIKSI